VRDGEYDSWRDGRLSGIVAIGGDIVRAAIDSDWVSRGSCALRAFSGSGNEAGGGEKMSSLIW